MNDLSESGTTYRFDEVEIDPEDFTVTKSGDALMLTPRSFDVLLYLVRNQGRVVEKQELFEAIWKDTFVTDNALTRVMKEIRAVLGDRASEPRYIETVHKRGYRFIADVSVGPRHPAGAVVEADDLSAESGYLPARKFVFPKYALPALIIIVAFAAVAGFYALGDRTTIRTIAVLPFTNESGDLNVEYLADGITETLISSLSQLPNLNVKSRSSVFRYKASEIPLKTVGRELGVEAVVTGRVVQRGEDLTLYLSLIDPATENNIWSKQYTSQMAGLITLQSEIANDVAKSLGATLTVLDEQRIARNYTDDPEAYRLYLQGRFHVLSTRSQGAETGISYYRQAIALDPTYALAYAGLAQAVMGLAFRSEIPSNDIFPQAKNDATRAVEIDPQLADGYIALASVNMWFERDWDSARANIERALALVPDSADARLHKGTMLYSIGREAEGLEELKRATDIDPLNLRNLIVRAQFLNFAGRSDEALHLANRTLELNPNFYLGHLMVATAKLQLGETRGAIEAAEMSRALNPVDSLPITLKCFGLYRSGNAADGKAALDELLAASNLRYVTPYNIALAYHARNDTDGAISWLDRAVEQRDIRTLFLKDPKWDGLRQDPRFRDIVSRAGLSWPIDRVVSGEYTHEVAKKMRSPLQ